MCPDLKIPKSCPHIPTPASTQSKKWGQVLGTIIGDKYWDKYWGHVLETCFFFIRRDFFSVQTKKKKHTMPKTWQNPEERLEYNRRWFASEKGFQLRKRVILERACKNRRLPSISTMNKYNINVDEIETVYNNIKKQMT